jgi:peroxiredoxin
MPAKIEKILAFLLLVVFLFVPNLSKPAEAIITACSAAVDISEVQPNVNDITFNFTVTNDDAVDIKWFQITKPFSGLTTTGVILSDWRKSTQGEVTLFTDGTLTPGNSVSPRITVNVGDIAGSSGNWLVEVSDDTGGANSFTCSGSLGLTVTAEASDVTAPQISSLAVSSITSSSAVVTWTSDELATSYLEYGLETDVYSLNKSSATLSTSHSLTPDNLGAGTTYYYRVCSTDAASNQGCTGENTFTTASATSTGSATATTTTTTTTTTTQTVIRTLTDKTAPSITITTDFDEPFEQPPLITGRATDKSRIAGVDYSTDGGVNWLPVDEIISPGATSTEFSFVPEIFDDGNYEIAVRAIDGAGNRGTSKTYTLVIDRLPPLVGGNLLSLGPLILMPNEDGVIVTMAGIEQKITLSTVGGPISIDLYANETMYSLPRSPETGLWSGTINFPDSGIYKLLVKAIDGAENKTERELNSIVVTSPGRLIEKDTQKAINDAEVSVFYKDALTGIWTLWDAKPFGQENPQIVDQDGNYRFFLPPGAFYIQIKASGFTTLISKIFSITSPTPLSQVFELEKGKLVQIGSFSFYLPDFSGEKADINITAPAIPTELEETSLVGKEAPVFTLPTASGEFDLVSLRGKPSVITFISTWSPPSLEQISVLDSLDEDVQIAAVAIQETISKISIFQKRGNYSLPIVIDADGRLVEKYNLNSLPTHFFLDRKGIVKKVVTGVLNKEEIENILTEVR